MIICLKIGFSILWLFNFFYLLYTFIIFNKPIASSFFFSECFFPTNKKFITSIKRFIYTSQIHILSKQQGNDVKKTHDNYQNLFEEKKNKKRMFASN